MTNVFINGWVNLPIRILTTKQRESFRQTLTYKSPFTNDDGSYKTVNMYRETDEWFSVPIEWAKKHYPAVLEMAEDRRVTPGKLTYSKLPDPDHPAVKDPAGQRAFMEALLEAVQTKHNVLAVAKTGSGKTVCALRTAALLGHRTLVLVDKNDLKEQWIREIQDKLGVPLERIGIIQQDKCEWEDKDIVVGLLQTNARREYSDDVYNAFGTVIVDECDVLSTEFFAEIVPRFNAKYRIGLTATPKRKDRSDVILFYHLGNVRVTSEAEILPVKVHVFKYYKEGKVWGKDANQEMLSISKDKDFNAILADYTLNCFKAGRDILVVAEKIDQLELLVELCTKRGIPVEDMGMYTAQVSKYDRTYEWKKIGRRKTTQEELDIAKTKKIVFATIGMVKRAIDVPRWDTLIEAAPFWNAEQLIGRIRRKFKGKKFPVVITFRHMKSVFAEERYYSRYKEYVQADSIIVNHK